MPTLIDIAIDQSSVEILERLNTLPLEPSLYSNDLNILINGSIDEINNKDKCCRPYNQKDVSIARRNLEREAYGNFNEAMEDIRYDIVSIDRTQEGETSYTDIYRPELFNVEEAGLVLWNRLRSFIADNFGKGYFEGLDDKVEQLVEEIRNYQQKSYGPLIPSIAATYISRPNATQTLR